jgi:hypothetical protein
MSFVHDVNDDMCEYYDNKFELPIKLSSDANNVVSSDTFSLNINTGSLNSSLNSTTSNLGTSSSGLNTSLNSSLNSTTSNLGTSSSGLNTGLNSSLNSTTNNLGISSSGLNSSLNSTISSFDSLSTGPSDLISSLNISGNNVSANASNVTGDITSSLSNIAVNNAHIDDGIYIDINTIMDNGNHGINDNISEEREEVLTPHIIYDEHILNPYGINNYNRRPNMYREYQDCSNNDPPQSLDVYRIKNYADTSLYIQRQDCNNFNSSIMHALFDQYLFPHCGNFPNSSVKFFKQNYKSYAIKSNISSDNRKLVLKLLKKTLKFNGQYDNQLFDIKDMTQLGNWPSIENRRWNIKFSEYFDGKNDYILKSLLYNDYVGHYLSFFNEMYKQSKIYNKKIKDTEFIFTSGYKNHFRGHMICFYVKKVSDDYEVYLTNTGEGINNHIKKGDNVQCIVKNIISDEQFKRLLFLIQMFNNVIIGSIAAFYAVLKDFVGFKIKESVSWIEEDEDYLPPQLSGSCTYFSLLYVFKILFYKYKISFFEEFNAHVQDTSVDKLMEYIRIRYVEPKYLIPYSLKTFIDILPRKFEKKQGVINVKNYYTSCVSNYINACFQNMSNGMFKSEIIPCPTIITNVPKNIIFNNCNRVTELFDIIVEIGEKLKFISGNDYICDMIASNLIIAHKVANYGNKNFYNISYNEIKKIIKDHCNSWLGEELKMQIFILLININEHNNNILFSNDDSGILNPTDRVKFICNFVTNNVDNNQITQIDMTLLLKYKHLLLAQLKKEDSGLNVSELTKSIVIKKNYLKEMVANFIFNISKYAYGPEIKRLELNFSPNLAYVEFEQDVGAVPMLTYINTYYHKLIQVLQANKNYLELNDINITKIELTDIIFSSNYIYQNFKHINNIYTNYMVLNLQELVNYDNFSNILNNIVSYKINIILFVCAILIKNNINYIRKFKDQLSVLKNYNSTEENKKCIELILGCVDKSNIVSIDIRYLISRQYDRNSNLMLFVKLYLSTIVHDENIRNIVMTTIVYETNSVQINIDLHNKNFPNSQIIIHNVENGYFICSHLDNMIKISMKSIEASNFSLKPDFNDYIKNNYINCELYLLNIYSGDKLYTTLNSNCLRYKYRDVFYENTANYNNIAEYDNTFVYKILKYICDNEIMYFYNVTEGKIIFLLSDTYYENSEVIFIYDVGVKNLSILLNGQEHEVIIASDATNNMFVKWIYMIPFCLLIKKNGSQSIFLIENKYKYTNLFESIDGLMTNGQRFIKKLDNPIMGHKNYCHIIEFKPFGLSLAFSDYDSYKKYILLCLIFSRSDCLKVLLPQFYSTYKQTLELESERKKYIELMISQVIQEGFNNLYSRYFKYIINGDNEYLHVTKENLEYNNTYNIKYTLKINYENINIPNIFTKIKQLNKKYKTILDSKTIDYSAEINKLENIEVKSHIEEFKKIYKKCENPKLDVDFITYKQFESPIKLSYEQIFINYINNNENVVETILRSPKPFYNIIDCETCMRFAKELQTNKCDEVRKIYDIIDEETIFTNSDRDMEVVLFEIIFGKLIRRDQYNLYKRMYAQMIGNGEKHVYQMLMGKGKSSVITPLLAIKLSYSEIYNTFLILPKHLIKQATKEITDYIQVMQCSKINYLDCPHTIEKILHVVDAKQIKEEILNEIQYMNHVNINAFIIDEFDSLHDPLSCELNSPLTTSTITKNNPFGEVFDAYVQLIIEIYKQHDNEEVRKTVVEKYCKEFIKKESGDIMRWQIATKLSRTLAFCIKSNDYNRTYGFPLNDSHYSKFYAVPYEAVGKPVSGSYFSSLDINITFTILSYLTRGFLLKADFKNTIKRIRQYKQYKIFFGDDKFYQRLRNMFGEIINEKHFNNIIHDAPNVCDTIYDEYIKELVPSKNIIQYLQNIVIPSIKFTIDQKNCAFIDIINKFVMQKKVGFSGTFNMDLPIWDEPMHEFTTIIPESKDTGSTYFSFLGIDNNNKKTFIQLENYTLEHIIYIINTYNYNCLIDCGALLKNYTHNIVIRALTMDLYHRYVIYIDEDDNKMVFDKVSRKSTIYVNKVYPREDLFIYYDNRNIVGVDIKQPFVLKGLVTIDSANNFTTVSQGIYRLRNLNYGHIIDIILSDELNKKLLKTHNSNRRVTILDRLLYKDRIYKDVYSRRKLAIQNAKYINRRFKNFNAESYIENKIENINYVAEPENIIEKLIKNEDNNDIIQLYNILNQIYKDTINVNITTVSLEGEEEEEEEEEEEQESEQDNRFAPWGDNKDNKIEFIIDNVTYACKIPIRYNGESLEKIQYFSINNIYISNNVDFNSYCNNDGYSGNSLGYVYFIKQKYYYIADINELIFIENMQKISGNNNIQIWRNNYDDNLECDKSLIVKVMCGFKLNLINLIKVIIAGYNNNPNDLKEAFNDYNYCFCNKDNKIIDEFIIRCLEEHKSYSSFKTYIQRSSLSELQNSITEGGKLSSKNKIDFNLSDEDEISIKNEIQSLFSANIYISS